MMVIEEQVKEMRSTDDTPTERDEVVKLQMDLQRAVERATLQLESRALRNTEAETEEPGFEFELANELAN